ncbi:MAG: zinc metalloprotease HtpX [Desulfurococcaceae archaeon]
MLFWLLYDPVLLITMILAYVIGFTVMIIAAGYVAPRVARKFAGRFSLQASMAILGLVVVVAGLSGIGIVAYVLASIIGLEYAAAFVLGVLLLVLVLNVFTYLLSPLMINLMYRAKPDQELQKIVDEVAAKLGFSKPPRAVVVEGPPNAFAYGNFLAGKYVAVTRSMLAMTPLDEIKAVVGHELGHHKHRDNAIMLFMGLLPSVLYFLGISLMRYGLVVSYARGASSRERREGGAGLALMLAGVLAIVLSFLVQVLVLAFSRLREYYADTAGAYATSPRHMQRALARLHVYYNTRPHAAEVVQGSKLKALFIYAFTEAYASPFYSTLAGGAGGVDIDKVVEELRRVEREEGISEFLATHPPIHKRIKFLDKLYSVFKP